MPEKRKIAACYIRVSTDDQLEYSPDSQLNQLSRYAGQHQLFLPPEFIFREEEGISGKRAEKRPQFMRMIRLAKGKPRPFDVILVWKFSRFARSRRDSIVYKSMLRKQCGIDVISVTEQLGDDKMSLLVEALIEAMDEYYSINLAEEVKRGMTEKVQRGEPVAAPPFGYRMKEKQYVPDPAAAPVVQMIYEEFVSGQPYQGIARRLNQMGIPTGRGKLWENRAVEYVLRNPVYAGKIRWNPTGWTRRNYGDPHVQIVESSHTPLVSQELWQAAQDRAERLKKQYGQKGRAASPHPYPLRGLVRCSSCGRALAGAHAGSLQCSGYAHGACADSHSISCEKLERLVLQRLRFDFGAAAVKIRPRAIPSIRNTQSFLRSRLEREREKLARAREAYLGGADTLKEYEAGKSEILSRIARLEEELAACSKPDAPARQPAVPALTAPQKNAVLRSFIDRIVLDRAQRSVKIYYRCAPFDGSHQTPCGPPY